MSLPVLSVAAAYGCDTIVPLNTPVAGAVATVDARVQLAAAATRSALTAVDQLAQLASDLLDAMQCGNDPASLAVIQQAVQAVQLAAQYSDDVALAARRVISLSGLAAASEQSQTSRHSLALQREMDRQMALAKQRMDREVGAAMGVVRDAYSQERDRQRQANDKAKVVFSYWVAATGRSERTVYDARRESRIVARLKENGGNIDELLYAIDGAVKDPWLSGKDPKTGGKKYDGIETILRDRAQVERLAETQRGYRNDEPHPIHAIRAKQQEAGDGE